MSQRILSRRAGGLLRTSRLSPCPTSPALRTIHKLTPSTTTLSSQWQTRSLSSSAPRHGLMPESSDPPPKESEPTHFISEPTPLEDDKFHELSDQYIDSIVSKMEEVQEGREDVDVEYSAGVLSITFPPAGTYIINKQPPNKQIWLSSPITGPKRFDWVVLGESVDSKEGSGRGDWIYLRDGTSLTEVLRKEFGISVGTEEFGHGAGEV